MGVLLSGQAAKDVLRLAEHLWAPEVPSHYTGRTPSSLPDVEWRYSPLCPQPSPADPMAATGNPGGVATEPEPLSGRIIKMYLLSRRGVVCDIDFCSATRRHDRLAQIRASAPPDQFRPAQYRRRKEDAHFQPSAC